VVVTPSTGTIVGAEVTGRAVSEGAGVRDVGAAGEVVISVGVSVISPCLPEPQPVLITVKTMKAAMNRIDTTGF
jgi:hypothetical protein